MHLPDRPYLTTLNECEARCVDRNYRTGSAAVSERRMHRRKPWTP